MLKSGNDLHSPYKCLAWVKKCHVWLDKNFDPFLLLPINFDIFSWEMKQKNLLKKSKWTTKKNAFQFPNSQYFFAKISWINPLVSRID